MNKMNGFTINRISLSGFKCFAEETSFDFGDMTFIHGANHSGKTGIADAISFAVTGHPFFGDKSSDRLENPNGGGIRVTLDITDDLGFTHQLIRSRKKGKASVSLDGIPVRQTDLNEVFGEPDVFLSIFNPLYFIEELAKDGKKLLEKLLPPVPHELVLAELNEQIRSLLDNEKLISPAYLQNRRAEIRELEDALLYQQGQDDALAKQIEEKGRLLEEYRRRTEGLAPDNTLDIQILVFDLKLKDRHAEQYQSQYAQTIEDLSASLKALYDGYARFDKLKKDGVCPTCFQETGDSKAVSSAMTTIVSSGKSVKEQLADARELDEKSKAVFDQFKASDIAAWETELADLRARYDQSQRLLDDVTELQTWLSDNSVSDKANSIRETIKAKKALLSAAAEYIAKRAELTFANLSMNLVRISLYDVIKSTGEVKDTFRFTFEGRPYRWLSLSEKVRAGLEVSELIKNLTGRCYPTFIDNGESVTSIQNVRPSGQTFFAKVVHGQPLSVTYRGAAVPKAAA
jgi:DNA repair exonuclease SbcCD ATPase subunit